MLLENGRFFFQQIKYVRFHWIPRLHMIFSILPVRWYWQRKCDCFIYKIIIVIIIIIISLMRVLGQIRERERESTWILAWTNANSPQPWDPPMTMSQTSSKIMAKDSKMNPHTESHNLEVYEYLWMLKIPNYNYKWTF